MSGLSSFEVPAGEDDREHQRQDDAVVAGELEDDDHGRDRRACCGGEDGAHPDEPVGAGRGGDAGEEVVHAGSVGGAEHRADEERWCEHAARAADRDRQAGREELAHEQGEEQPDDVVAVDCLLERRIADAVQFRQDEQQEAEQEATGGRTEPLRAAPEPVGEVFAAVEDADECDPGEGGEQP